MAEEQPIKSDSAPAAAGPPAGTPAPAPTAAPSPAPADPNVFSLEDLDKIIESEDPGFKKEIEALKDQKLELSADHENLSVKTDDDHLSKDEQKDENEGGALRKFLQKLLINPCRRLLTFSRMQGIALFNRFQQFFSRTIAFLRHGLPERLKYYKSRALGLLAALKKIWSEFKKMSRAQILALTFICIAGIAALFFLSKTVTGEWLPRYHDSMPRSLLEHRGLLKSYADKSELQDLFLAFPEVEYYVLLKRVVVNLRPSENSGPNPMGTFEVYVGVDTQDTAIEVKDREREIVDIVQRALEGFTYDDSASIVGKSRMKEVIRDRINEILNQGRVFHIYFNTFVVYSGA